MNDRKTESAEFLLDEIGGIDESFVCEAANLPKKKKTPILRYTALIAACMALVVGIFTMPRIFVMLKGDCVPEGAEEPGVIRKSEKNCVFSRNAEDKLADGESLLLWQTGENTPVYCISVGKDDTAKIISLLGKGSPYKQSKADALPMWIWIRFDDGKTVSPFLDPPDLYGFSPYEPTVMPCDELYSLLMSYIESEADNG